MLLELMVENYAVVEQARIRFGEGLNILTGETGSGKSIVVDSLGLLLGARASAEMIRAGEAKARVSGVFTIEPDEIAGVLEEAGISLDSEEELIVEREITANGKSRAYVANRPVTTAFLRQLAPALGDIHGQNEQQSLFSPAAQRDLLDEYSGTQDLRRTVSEAYGAWREAEDKLADVHANQAEKLRLLDMSVFQRNEIDAVAPQSGEDVQLEAERKVLQNVTRLQESAGAAYEALYDAPQSVAAQLRHASKRLDELTRIDTSLADTSASLQQASVLIDDAAYSLRDYLGKLEGDPARLETVEARLAALDRLRRKYGGSLEAVIEFRTDVARKADEVENASEHEAALERKRALAKAEFDSLATKLSAARAESASRLSKAVEVELKGLAMGGTRFAIAVTPGTPSRDGADEVRFLVAPNRGEELKPLERIASGGELSRIALALKTAATAEGDRHLNTLVFDEVDAGVGGAAAAAVGKRLKTLSRFNQVICVTHLAQIAGFADYHFSVAKREKRGRISMEVIALEKDDRAREIGRMLSGEHVTPEALKQAEQLMQAGKLS
jgi:DNA repair protein RecN (Recombination protein N)